MTGQQREPHGTTLGSAAASHLPKRRLAMLRPGMVVPGVIKRLVRGGALVDILLESGELAFIPLSEIPAKGMPKVREMIAKGLLQEVRLLQLDRAGGTATCSLQGLVEGLPPEEEKAKGRRGRFTAPEPPPPPKITKPTPVGPPKISASERARRQQEEILRRMRGE